jgi:CRP-like cAMP-binding protein
MAKRRPTGARSPSRQRLITHPNQLLAALPPDDFKRVNRSLSTVPVKVKQMLHYPGEPVDHVYFPGSGFASVLTILEDGRMIEVATVGREGAVGVSAVVDGAINFGVAMVQAHIDPCFRMSVAAYRSEMDRRGAFYDLLMHYSQAMIGFVMQSTACNAVHRVDQRLARWLLLAQDRVGSDTFPLTQEFVAMMLGVARPTVSIVAGTLQRAGLITYRHGVMRIVDREGLEEASCECYRTATAMLAAVTEQRASIS